MIRQISGRIVHKTQSEVVVSAGGVGYRIEVPSIAKLPPLESTVTLWTHLRVREDAMDLYGFLTIEELNVFESMLKVQRFPARTALAVLAHCGVDGFGRAVAEGDLKALTGIPGVGKKTAQQLLLELRGKIDLAALPAVDEKEPLDDPALALVELGYSAADARAIVKKVRDANPAVTDSAEIVKLSLRKGR